MQISSSFDRALTSVISDVDVSLQDALPAQILAAYNKVCGEGATKKKFASKEKGLDAIWAVLDSFPVNIKANKVLEVASEIGYKIKPSSVKFLQDELASYKALAPISTPAATTANKAPAKSSKAALASSTALTKTPASGRTTELVTVFKKSGPSLHVDELAKIMNTTVQTIRNTIDAARRGKHNITSQGKGVFLYSDPDAKPVAEQPAAETVAEQPAAETVAEAPKKDAKAPRVKKATKEKPVVEQPAVTEEPAAPEPEQLSEKQPAPEPEATAEEEAEPLSELLNISQGDDAEEPDAEEPDAEEPDAEEPDAEEPESE